jgi:hypothetical protein
MLVLIIVVAVVFVVGLAYLVWKAEQLDTQRYREHRWWNDKFWHIIHSIDWNDDRDFR